MTYDLDRTDRCPRGPVCESCEQKRRLDVITIETPVGVLCATVCGRCLDADTLPRIASWRTAVERVMDHCGHLGIDADQMAAAMDAEEES